MNKLLSGKALALSVLALFASESCGMNQQMMVIQPDQGNKYCKDIVKLLPLDKQDEFRSWFAPTVHINSLEVLELLKTLRIELSAEITDSCRNFAQFIDDQWEKIRTARAEAGNRTWPGVAEYYKSKVLGAFGEDPSDYPTDTRTLKEIVSLICPGIIGNGTGNRNSSPRLIWYKLGCLANTKEMLDRIKCHYHSGRICSIKRSDKNRNDRLQGWSAKDSAPWKWFMEKGISKCRLDQLRSLANTAIALGGNAICIDREARRSAKIFIKFLDENWFYLQPFMDQAYAKLDNQSPKEEDLQTQQQSNPYSIAGLLNY